jgi:hypothetical protein
LDRALSTLSKWAHEPPGEANARCWVKDSRIKCRRARKRIPRSHGPALSLEHASQADKPTVC